MNLHSEHRFAILTNFYLGIGYCIPSYLVTYLPTYFTMVYQTKQGGPPLLSEITMAYR